MGLSLPPVCQITDSHCGPAVVELLLSGLGISITQDEIVTAARAKSRIEKFGTRPDHLAKAVANLFPSLQFWFKQQTTRQDLDTLINGCKIPVAINWQGLFYDTLDEEKHDFPKKNIYGDHGHYSVITGIDLAQGKVKIQDTYFEYFKTSRTFTLDWFESRWWDKDLHVDKKTGKSKVLTTDKLSFLIIDKSVTLPPLGYQLPEMLPKYKETSIRIANLQDGSIKSHRHV